MAFVFVYFSTAQVNGSLDEQIWLLHYSSQSITKYTS